MSTNIARFIVASSPPSDRARSPQSWGFSSIADRTLAAPALWSRPVRPEQAPAGSLLAARVPCVRNEETILPAPAAPSLQAALTAARDGGPDALGRLVEALYPDLRRIARAQLRRLRPGRTLDTTSLVHEAYVKLVKSGEFADRVHFLSASARAMRHILVNAARRKLAEKHGGGREPGALDDNELGDEGAQYAEILDVGEALDRLQGLDDRLCRLVECRFYAGMTEEETAAALDVSDRTVRRDWLRARAWLKQELGRIPAPAEGSAS